MNRIVKVFLCDPRFVSNVVAIAVPNSTDRLKD